MNILRYVDMINEATINFDKINNDKYSAVLLNKLRNNDAFVSDGVEIKIKNQKEIIKNITDDDGNWDPVKAKEYLINGRMYTYVFLGDDGYYYRLSQFDKTAEFGSSGGSSLGSVDTAYVESIQCLLFAFRQEKGRRVLKSDKKEIIKDLDNLKMYIETKSNITVEIFEKYWNSWNESLVKMTNAMYDAEHFMSNNGRKVKSTILDKRFKYTFCRESGDVLKSIKKSFNDSKKNLKINPQISKWSPADIWAVQCRKERIIIDKLKDIKTFRELNAVINELFDSKILVGMSLKKVTKDEEIKIIINKEDNIPKFTLKDIKISSDPTSTTGVTINVIRSKTRNFPSGEESITLRKFSEPRDIDGEINGKSAKHGKISLNIINYILIKYEYDPVPLYKDDTYYEFSIVDMTDDEILSEINSINDMIYSKYNNVTTSRKSKEESNRYRLISKYQSLYFSWILMTAHNKIDEKSGLTKADRIIQDIFYYALSINLTGTYNGRTPKYVRVVD